MSTSGVDLSKVAFFPVLIKAWEIAQRQCQSAAFAFKRGCRTMKALKEKVALATLTAPIEPAAHQNVPQLPVAKPAIGSTPQIKLPGGRRRRPSIGVLGQQIAAQKAQVVQETEKRETKAEAATLLACVNEDREEELLSSLPPYVSQAVRVVLDQRILLVGRFSRKISKEEEKSISVQVLVKLFGGSLMAPKGTKLMEWIHRNIPIVIISAFLYEEYTELGYHGIPASDLKMSPRQLHQTVINVFGRHKCRGYQWYHDLNRLLEALGDGDCVPCYPGVTRESISNFYFHGTEGSPLLMLPWTQTDLYQPLYSSGDSSLTLSFASQIPSRTLYVLPFDPADQACLPPTLSTTTTADAENESLPNTCVHTPDTAALALLHTPTVEQRISLVFHTIAREVVSRFVRSPSRNVLLTAKMALALLSFLLDSQDQSSNVLLYILLPIGMCNEQIDLSMAAYPLRAMALNMLNKIESSLRRHSRFKVHLVSSTWIEDGWFYGCCPDVTPYIVDPATFMIQFSLPTDQQLLSLPPASPDARKRQLVDDFDTCSKRPDKQRRV
eukprot:Blabericola_migrator_1__13053@NODE_87_length_14713_cov_55_061450_g78_i0_p3_GENE_NODE_87_length_14713_cov_55_061450_g78_i0NODE_87_length_14713_cov_55_061450_g78_i0_p3_ORF_typecomplete_len554_score96_83_NODE_87_length_14713_cov_55_061450_g78_i036775338